jgi:hypothetical protein
MYDLFPNPFSKYNVGFANLQDRLLHHIQCGVIFLEAWVNDNVGSTNNFVAERL